MYSKIYYYEPIFRIRYSQSHPVLTAQKAEILAASDGRFL
jgi:hypothetical protein